MRTPPPRTVQIARVLLLSAGLLIIIGASITVTATAERTSAQALTHVIAAGLLLVAGLCYLVLAWRLKNPSSRADSLALALLGATITTAVPQLFSATQGFQSPRLVFAALLVAVSVAAILVLAQGDSRAWHRPDHTSPLWNRPTAITVATAALAVIGLLSALTFSGQFLMVLVAAPGNATLPLGELGVSLTTSFVLFAGALVAAIFLWPGREIARVVSIVLAGGAILTGLGAMSVIVDPFFRLHQLPMLAAGITIVVALSRVSSRTWCAAAPTHAASP